MISIQTAPFGRFMRGLAVLLTAVLAAIVAQAVVAARPATAAPYAAYLMDARTGETLYEENADTRLHPASLTKMMTLYIAFQEIEAGRVSLDTLITVSKNAAAQPPSRLGLKAGQKIQLRYLIRAAAVKSANDAAAAIGDALGGNQAQFADHMTRVAQSLGMRNSTFKNANGLTSAGHLSTAKDMSILGRHLFYDFPQYYNIFSRRSTDAGLATVASTNRKFLDAYKGADGIKTGFTQPAGFNLTASAERNGVRLIATVFGGVSTPDRNARVAKLLDKGFAMVKGGGGPAPVLTNADDELVASAAVPEEMDGPADGKESSGKTLRVTMAVTSSPRPMARPDMSETIDGAEVAVAAMAGGIAGALAEASAPEKLPFAVVDDTVATDAQGAASDVKLANITAVDGAEDGATTPRPRAKPADLMAQVAPDAVPEVAPEVAMANAQPDLQSAPEQSAPEQPTQDQPEPIQPAAQIAALSPQTPDTPPKRKAPIYDDVAANAPSPPKGEVVTRVSTSGANHFGINVGRFNSADSAERILLKMQLVESATLSGSLRRVTEKGGGYDANFLGLTQEAAELACRRLNARAITCIPLGM